MNYQINLRADPGYEKYNPLVETAAKTVLEMQNATEGGLSVVLTSSEYLEHLNTTYRKQASATDVLSFPDGEKDPETRNVYFGDVVVAVPEATAQAESSGHSIESELNLLITHGVLHLLGFTHDEDNTQKAMWAAQAAVLARLGNEFTEPPPYVPGDVEEQSEEGDESVQLESDQQKESSRNQEISDAFPAGPEQDPDEQP